MFKLLKKVIFAIACIGGIMNGNCSGIQEIKFEFTGGTTQTYSVVTGVLNAKYFVSDCIEAQSVSINGKKEEFAPMDIAMKTLLLNVVNSDTDTKIANFDILKEKILTFSDDMKGKIAMLTWIGYQEFSSVSPDTSGICLNLLNKIASSNYYKAVWVLRSQCSDSNYIPLDSEDWSVIGNAIHLLKNEKNGHTADAARLLASLKTSGKYIALLGK